MSPHTLYCIPHIHIFSCCAVADMTVRALPVLLLDRYLFYCSLYLFTYVALAFGHGLRNIICIALQGRHDECFIRTCLLLIVSSGMNLFFSFDSNLESGEHQASRLVRGWHVATQVPHRQRRPGVSRSVPVSENAFVCF